MSWSWKIGRIAGIDVNVHVSFLLLVGWVVAVTYMAHDNLWAAAAGVGFILALFGIVVLHELGHALAARQFGIGTRDITLLPIGGVARIERIPQNPWQELVIAVAGPAVNVVLAAAIYIGLWLGGGLISLSESAQVGGSFLGQLFWVNVALVLFNLLPAFPMDGGRVLRALLAMRLDYVQATQIAAAIGQGMAILFVCLGLFGNPFLMLIGLFVWLGAAEEASFVQMRSALNGIPVMRAMVTEFHALLPDTVLSKVIKFAQTDFQQDFPVVDEDGRLMGLLTRDQLVAAIAQHGPDARVADVMQKEYVVTSPRETLESAFERLRDCSCHTLPVVDEKGRVLGLLTADNVTEVLMIQQALQRAAGERRVTGQRTTAGSSFKHADTTLKPTV